RLERSAHGSLESGGEAMNNQPSILPPKRRRHRGMTPLEVIAPAVGLFMKLPPRMCHERLSRKGFKLLPRSINPLTEKEAEVLQGVPEAGGGAHVESGIPLESDQDSVFVEGAS
ncbi:hypothetical protein U1Q18_001139, partial [Sarracenia purpurea var. burkii]